MCETRNRLDSPVSSTSSLLLSTNAYKLISYWLVSLVAPEELLTAAKTLVDSYPNDLNNSFVDELCHFAKFTDIFKDNEPGNVSTELFLYKLIITAGQFS